MKNGYFFIVLLSVFLSCNDTTKTTKEKKINRANNYNSSLSIAEKIAMKNGSENWDKISELRYTFNVVKGEKKFYRSWIWSPKTGDVIMRSAMDTIQYNRNAIDSLSEKFDKAFINDKFWLLAPFNLVWDSGIVFAEKTQVISPISRDTLNQLTIVYNDEGGYTPGDAYDFFYDSSYEIKEWNFRIGNSDKISLSTTWEDYKTINEITFATMHQDSSGNFKVYFTDLMIK